MTDDEILAIAESVMLEPSAYATTEDIIDFARAIAAKEREECLKLAELAVGHEGDRNALLAAIRARVKL